MNTDESSPQLKPFEEQPLPPPDQAFGGELPATATPSTAAVLASPWWEPWFGALKAGLVWFASILILALLPLVVMVPYVIYKLLAGGPASPEAIVKDPSLLFISVVAILPVHALTFLLGWWFVTSGGKYPFWKSIGFEWPENLGPRMGVILSVLLALVLYAIAVLITSLWGGAKTDIDLLIESSMPARFVLAFAAVATAPLVEELIYRGILYTALERATGKVISIFVVSLLFSGVHVIQYLNNLSVIFMITILSFALTTTRAVTGKLLPSFIIHLVFNGVQSILIVIGAFVDHELLK